MKSKLVILFAAALIVAGCQNKSKKAINEMKDTTTVAVEDTVPKAKNDTSSAVAEAPKTEINKEAADKIRAFLVKKYEKDLKIMEQDERKFSFYEVDMNDDGKNEYFVKMESRYFCGSGGCTFILLNNDFTQNSYFTVMFPPVFRSFGKTNGWHDIILFGDQDEKGGVKNYIHLKFDKAKGKYPSNPSLIKKIEMAPSGSDIIMWDDKFGVPAQILSF